MNRILIYDTDGEFASQCKQSLNCLRHWVVSVADAPTAVDLLSKQYFHVVLWQVDSEAEVDFLFRLHQSRMGSAMIAILPKPDTQLVVAAMRAGAAHVWTKDNSLDALVNTVSETLSRFVSEPLVPDTFEFPCPEFIGRHPKILEIFQLILSIKDTDSTVLITGESGTGKEVVSRAIHHLSPRAKYPWIAVNCSAIPANLLESELFGHVRGAFTGATQNRVGRFQLAGSGTLFLDEISDLSFDLQAKILRAIQNRVYEPVGSAMSLTLDARIIAASNQNLESQVAEKKFREDLYYRLNVIPLYIPALRERRSDVPMLVKAFLDRFNSMNGKQIPGISKEAMQCLMQYHWPGNVRELENLMERVVVLKRSPGSIELKDFPVGYFKNVRLDRFVSNVALPEDGIDFDEAVNQFENELILQALQRTAGNRNKAATLLNINRTTLVEKLKRKGLTIS